LRTRVLPGQAPQMAFVGPVSRYDFKNVKRMRAKNLIMGFVDLNPRFAHACVDLSAARLLSIQWSWENTQTWRKRRRSEGKRHPVSETGFKFSHIGIPVSTATRREWAPRAGTGIPINFACIMVWSVNVTSPLGHASSVVWRGGRDFRASCSCCLQHFEA
jgi:hypothetical protein